LASPDEPFERSHLGIKPASHKTDRKYLAAQLANILRAMRGHEGGGIACLILLVPTSRRIEERTERFHDQKNAENRASNDQAREDGDNGKQPVRNRLKQVRLDLTSLVSCKRRANTAYHLYYEVSMYHVHGGRPGKPMLTKGTFFIDSGPTTDGGEIG
jgi:hypothetical protein